MKDIREYSNATDAIHGMRDDVTKILSFIENHLPEEGGWDSAGDLGHIRTKLLEVARFAGGFESSDTLVELIDNFEA